MFRKIVLIYVLVIIITTVFSLSAVTIRRMQDTSYNRGFTAGQNYGSDAIYQTGYSDGYKKSMVDTAALYQQVFHNLFER